MHALKKWALYVGLASLAGLVLVGVASANPVGVTINTSLTRTWHWSIQKSVDTPSLTLAPGQSATVNYSVTAATTGFTDSNWNVSGVVSAFPDGSGSPAVVVTKEVITVPPGTGNQTFLGSGCSLPLPATLNSGDPPLTCPYSIPLPNGNTQTLEAAVYHPDGSGNTASGTVSFGPPTTINKVDDCVDVTDSIAGTLGSVCQSTAPHTFTYPETISVPASTPCGTTLTFPNTATFVTNTTGTKGSASSSVSVNVQCPTTVTLTSTQQLTMLDNATVTAPTGSPTPTGTVTFNLFTTSDCSGTPLFTDTETLSGGQASTPTGTLVSSAGTFLWQVQYNGDANYQPATSNCGDESVTVSNG